MLLSVPVLLLGGVAGFAWRRGRWRVVAGRVANAVAGLVLGLFGLSFAWALLLALGSAGEAGAGLIVAAPLALGSLALALPYVSLPLSLALGFVAGGFARRLAAGGEDASAVALPGPFVSTILVLSLGGMAFMGYQRHHARAEWQETQEAIDAHHLITLEGSLGGIPIRLPAGPLTGLPTVACPKAGLCWVMHDESRENDLAFAPETDPPLDFKTITIAYSNQDCAERGRPFCARPGVVAAWCDRRPELAATVWCAGEADARIDLREADFGRLPDWITNAGPDHGTDALGAPIRFGCPDTRFGRSRCGARIHLTPTVIARIDLGHLPEDAQQGALSAGLDRAAAIWEEMSGAAPDLVLP